MTCLLSLLASACGNDETGVETAKKFYKYIDEGNIQAAAELRSSAQPYLQQGKTHVMASAGFSQAARYCGGFAEIKVTPSNVDSRKILEVDMTTKSPTRSGCANAKHFYEALQENSKTVLLSVGKPATNVGTAPAPTVVLPPAVLNYQNPTTSGLATQPLKN